MMSFISDKVLNSISARLEVLKREKKELSEKKADNFSYWAQWHFKPMVALEETIELWEIVQKNIASGVSLPEGMSDSDIKDFLIGFWKKTVIRIIQNTDKNSTNPISVEIQNIQEDAKKKFVGIDCLDTDSLSALIYDTFGTDIRSV